LWRLGVLGGTDRLDLNVRGQMEALRLNPDGRRALFLNVTESQEIWVLENFLGNSTSSRSTQ
jgi:hypothetical protein